MRSCSSSGDKANGPDVPTPALLTSRSGARPRRCAAAWSSPGPAGSRRSTATAWQRIACRCASSPARRSSGSASSGRAVITRSTPRCASLRAKASPMPDDAPVTSAACPGATGGPRRGVTGASYQRASRGSPARCALGPPCWAWWHRRRVATGCRRRRRSPRTGSAMPKTAMRGRWRGSRAPSMSARPGARCALRTPRSTTTCPAPISTALSRCPGSAARRRSTRPTCVPRSGAIPRARAAGNASTAPRASRTRERPGGWWRATSATAACSCTASAAGAKRSTSRRSARTSSSRSSGGRVRRASCAPPTAGASAPWGRGPRSSAPPWDRTGRSASARSPRSADPSM